MPLRLWQGEAGVFREYVRDSPCESIPLEDWMDLILRILLFCNLLFLIGCSSTRTSLPGHIEPHHHLRFQNGYVRVMETRLEPGQETHEHSHPLEAAVIFLTDGQFRIRHDDGTTEESTCTRGTVGFGAAPTVHRTKNIGQEIARVLVVEIFSQPPASGNESANHSTGELLLENDRVQVSSERLSKDAAVTLSGVTPSVVVAMNQGRLLAGTKVETLNLGNSVWCDTNIKNLRNAGRNALDLIIVTPMPRLNR